MWASSQIEEGNFVSLVQDARDFALSNGLVLRQSSNSVCSIPITLFPSPFPKHLYQECLDVQPIINKLMLKIATDIQFMKQTLDSVMKVDEFTRNLFDVNLKVNREGIAQPIFSCINRSDYMLDVKPNDFQVRQVEVNAIASSMSSHCDNVKKLQDFIMNKYRIKLDSGTELARNEGSDIVANGLIDCFNVYDKTNSYILVVTENLSVNFSDYFLTEVKINKIRPDIRIIRRRFEDLASSIKLGPNRELMLDNNKEIAVVYYRYCYDPTNYNFPGAWDLRLELERSKAIKCPTINFHLSGIKKFQLALNKSTQLEHLLTADESSHLSKLFCNIWSLESEDGYRLATSTSTASNLVLKPQREGGGHNIYSDSILEYVKEMADDVAQRCQYILMEYIRSPREKNWILRNQDDINKFVVRDCGELISELGIYGSIVADSNSIIHNKSGGYLIRSKNHGVHEGGVATGYAAIGGLLLIDNNDIDMSRYYHM